MHAPKYSSSLSRDSGVIGDALQRDAAAALIRRFSRAQMLCEHIHTGAPFCSLTEAQPATL